MVMRRLCKPVNRVRFLVTAPIKGLSKMRLPYGKSTFVFLMMLLIAGCATPDWIMEHEKAHCAGYGHDAYGDIADKPTVDPIKDVWVIHTRYRPPGCEGAIGCAQRDFINKKCIIYVD
jgi:hypothetical protein